MSRRRPLDPGQPSLFTAEVLESMAHTMKRAPIDRQTISDDVQTGLRAIITKDGQITLWGSYHVGEVKDKGKRPFIQLGVLTKDKKNPDAITIEDARLVTGTLRHLGETLGIDVEAEWHRRLIKELRTMGTKWRPDHK